MLTSEVVTLCAATFSLGIVLGLLAIDSIRRDFAWAPIYLSLLLIHPLCFTLADRADCGFGMRFTSVYVASLMAVVLGRQVFRWRIGRFRFAMILGLGTLTLYLSATPAERVVGEFYQMPAPEDGLLGQALLSLFSAEHILLLMGIAILVTTIVCCLFDRLVRRRRDILMHRRYAHGDS